MGGEEIKEGTNEKERQYRVLSSGFGSSPAQAPVEPRAGNTFCRHALGASQSDAYRRTKHIRTVERAAIFQTISGARLNTANRSLRVGFKL